MKRLQSKPRYFSIYITHECNWHCPYCHNANEHYDYNLDQIMHNINIIKPYLEKADVICLTGGEPGLVPEDILRYVLNSTNNLWTICTNGTFIENGYHKLFEKQIRKIYYHAIKDISQPFKFIKYDVPNIIYYVIINHDNIQYLDAFIQTNQDIIIAPKVEHPRIKREIGLEDIIQLYNIINKYTNICPDRKQQIVQILRGYQYTSNDICMLYNKNYGFDLIKNKIYRCCLTDKDIANIELNQTNVDNIFKSRNNNIFGSNDKFCERCNRYDIMLNIRKELCTL